MKILIICGLLLLPFALNASPEMHSQYSDNAVLGLNRNQLEEGILNKLHSNCTQQNSHSCMMLKLFVYINRIFKKSSIRVTENLEIKQLRNVGVQNEPEDEMLLARALRSNEEDLGVIIAEKIWQFIRTRKLRYKLHDNADIILATEPRGNLNIGLSIGPYTVAEQARGKMKNMGLIIAAIATKLGIIVALFMKGLLMLAGKALIVSKIALLLAVIIGLKKLLDKKRMSYDVMAHPHPKHGHETHHGHDTYGSGWARALDGFLDGFEDLPEYVIDAQNKAYYGQKPQT